MAVRVALWSQALLATGSLALSGCFGIGDLTGWQTIRGGWFRVAMTVFALVTASAQLGLVVTVDGRLARGLPPRRVDLAALAGLGGVPTLMLLVAVVRLWPEAHASPEGLGVMGVGVLLLLALAGAIPSAFTLHLWRRTEPPE